MRLCFCEIIIFGIDWSTTYNSTHLSIFLSVTWDVWYTGKCTWYICSHAFEYLCACFYKCMAFSKVNKINSQIKFHLSYIMHIHKITLFNVCMSKGTCKRWQLYICYVDSTFKMYAWYNRLINCMQTMLLDSHIIKGINLAIVIFTQTLNSITILQDAVFVIEIVLTIIIRALV